MKPVTKGPDRSAHGKVRRIGIALVLSTAALDAGAAGLGRLNLMSGIGQPLRAEIEVTALGRDEAGSLNARLASPDAFGQAGIEYGSALSNLRFSIQRRAGGQPYVLVTSNTLVNDPYLDVLVELSWSSGRLVREYTMLLDPPETRAAQNEVDPGRTIVQAQAPVAARTAPLAPAPAASPSSTGGGTPSTVAPASTSAPPRPSTTTGDYVVQSGDTAMSIARANKPDSVSLEQMLAVLYRDNRQAFGGNIDRLMAGATVKLPDAAAAQGVDGPEARRIIAQSANFGRYRERLAQNAAAAPATRADGQAASGRLTTQVQDNGAPGSDANDRLRLSRPESTATPTARTGERRGAAGPSTEELAAKDRELSETRVRVAQLEKNVSDLQQLLKLKNQTLADLQKGSAKAADSPAPAPAPASAPAATVAASPAAVAPVAAPPVVSPPPSAPAPVAPATTAPAAATPAPAVEQPPAPAKAAPAPIVDSSSDTPWYDALLDNTLLLAGLVVLALLLLGYGIVTMFRRRKLAGFEDSIFVDNSVLHANSVFGTTGGQSVDTANSGFHSNFVPVAGSLPQQSEVDPVAEADVYIAYGRDAQAEEILKEALRADGARQAVRLKLLEIYARRGDTKSFETTASELYAATGGAGDDWAQAAALGASIDPRNPLYGDAATPGSPQPAPVAAPSASDRATAIAAAAGAFSFSDIGVGASEDPPKATAPVDHTRTDPLPRKSATADDTPPSMDLDFDLGLGGGIAPLHEPAAPAGPAAEETPLEADDSFDFGTSETAKALADPFTASAFGSGDPATRTAVNLPAFRARAEQPVPNERPAAPPSASATDNDGFSASDIFGSSIVSDTLPYSATPPDDEPSLGEPSGFGREPIVAQGFEKTEPLDAFAKINLDLDDDFGGSARPDAAAKTEVWQAMATKLDLALAYSDIGDKDGARELLEEVVRSGDDAQSERARTLIDKLD